MEKNVSRRSGERGSTSTEARASLAELFFRSGVRRVDDESDVVTFFGSRPHQILGIKSLGYSAARMASAVLTSN